MFPLKNLARKGLMRTHIVISVSRQVSQVLRSDNWQFCYFISN